MKRILNRVLAMLLAAILLAAPVCAVQTVTARGRMDGTGAGKFIPNDGLTRATLATILWRMENCPTSLSVSGFSLLSGRAGDDLVKQRLHLFYRAARDMVRRGKLRRVVR